MAATAPRGVMSELPAFSRSRLRASSVTCRYPPAASASAATGAYTSTPALHTTSSSSSSPPPPPPPPPLLALGRIITVQSPSE